MDGNGFTPLRVFFRKTGRAKYISHLDLMRAMTRAVRRAGLPVWYTEGFNRHPYLTFAAPLSLGVEGLAECMDIRLTEALLPEEATARLAAVLPGGLDVTGAAPPVMKPGDIAFARYAIAAGGFDWAAFLAQEVIPVEKRMKKGGVKTVDLKPHLLDPAVEDGTLAVTLPAGSDLSLNPSLVLAACRAFAGENFQAGAVARLSLMDKEGRPFR